MKYRNHSAANLLFCYNARNYASFMEQRQIPRNPDTPLLTHKAIELLTQLCFRQDDVVDMPVDLIFQFSTHTNIKATVDIITDDLTKGLSTKVFVTGGFPTYEGIRQHEFSLAEMIMQHIDTARFPHTQFFREDISRNTPENITEALKVLDFSAYDRAVFIFKSHAAGRGYLTLRKYLPHTLLLQQTVNARYKGGSEYITRENWYETEFNRSRVYGEFLRIKTYGSRGDLDYSEVKGLIQDIDTEITADIPVY